MWLKQIISGLTALSLCACAQPPAPSFDPAAMLVWFQQRGVETRNLEITSRPVDNGASPSASGLPMRLKFKTPKPEAELELWRRALRDDFGAWLAENGHPEGQCTSVDVKPEKELLAVDIQIVCR